MQLDWILNEISRIQWVPTVIVFVCISGSHYRLLLLAVISSTICRHFIVSIISIRPRPLQQLYAVVITNIKLILLYRIYFKLYFLSIMSLLGKSQTSYNVDILSHTIKKVCSWQRQSGKLYSPFSSFFSICSMY